MHRTKSLSESIPPLPKVLKYWLIAVRPKTLSIAVAPVLTGTTLAWVDMKSVDWWVVAAAFIAAVLIQIGTNLHNDAADFERGADQAGTRLGPPRATAQGWLSATQVQRGAKLSFLLALLVGSYLVWVGGWPILLVGLFSIAAGLAYTGGPYPIAYSGFGELFVGFFFGVVAVAGSYYLQTDTVEWSALTAGLMLGMLAAAVLVVNNYRDLDNDKAVGKNTLAVRLGRGPTQVEYLVLMLVPFLLLPSLYLLDYGIPACLLPLLLLPWSVTLIRHFHQQVPGPSFNRLLASTAQLQLAFSGLLCLGLLLFFV